MRYFSFMERKNMNELNRRQFLQFSAAAGAAALVPASPASSAPKPMRLGVFVGIEKDPADTLARVRELEFTTCQIGIEDFSAAMETELKAAIEKTGIEITALDSLGPGPHVWDFYQGPLTIGLVPQKYRRERIDHFKRASDFAKKIGIPAFHTHNGFIPENPNDPVYKEVVVAIREVGRHCKSNGQMVLYETGQETPITMLRCIEDVGLDNQFVNLDTANLILYGTANPLDALDVIGKLVRGVHAKDGFYPTNPRELGREVPIGQGKVDFPGIIKRLKQLGYTGAITIEREITGPQQTEDIKQSKAYLEKIIG
jgi:L-ribulose-5-phosphate 3-epimerase